MEPDLADNPGLGIPGSTSSDQVDVSVTVDVGRAHGPTRHCQTFLGNKDRHSTSVPLTGIQEEPHDSFPSRRVNNVDFSVSIEVHKVAPHVDLLVEVLEVARRRVVDVANANQVTKLELAGAAHPWVADNSVPRFSRPIGVVPATDQVGLAVSGEIDQPTVVNQCDGAGLCGVVPEQVAITNHRHMGLRKQRWSLLHRTKANPVPLVLWITNHPLDTPLVAIGEIGCPCVWNEFSGCQVDDIDRIGIQHARNLALLDDLREVDHRIDRHIARGKRGRDRQFDRVFRDNRGGKIQECLHGGISS